MRIPDPFRPFLHGLLAAIAVAGLPALHVDAAALTFTVNASEPVTVTGTPRIAIDVGGITRYATYASGSGSTALTFSYAIPPGDFDANGITLASPLDLNGGSIADLAGNPASPLTFTLPDTSTLKVQTYTAAFTTSPITNTNANAISFAIAKAPTGASFSYSITSSGGTGSVTGAGTISGSSHTVSSVDVSNLATGTLTLSVTVSTSAAGTGTARTATITPTFSGVLDGLSASAAAYSVRRLRSAYSGPMLRVRRSSDNAMQDIRATVAGNLDTVTLASFCGSASCSVPTWYDQSGNGFDQTQATGTAQPLVINAGAAELLGGKPALRFDAAKLMQAANPLIDGNEFTIVMTIAERLRRYNWTWRLLTSTAPNPRLSSNIPWGQGSFIYDVQNSNTGRLITTWPFAEGAEVTLSFWNSVSANSRGVYPNGSLFRSGTGIAAATDALILGDGYGGQFSEFILFPTALSAGSRQSLERSQGSYYGTPVP